MIDVLVILVVFALLAVGATAATVGSVSLYMRVWQRLLSTITVPVADNRILYWPLALAIVWPLLLALLWLFYAVFWVPIISEIVFVMIGGVLITMWVGTVIVSFRFMKQWIAARYWRTIFSTLLLPLSFLLTITISIPLLKYNYVAIDDLQFFADYGSLLADVEKRPATEPRFMVWMWHGDDNFGVLYDETDQIASDHPSETWKKNAKKEGVICCWNRRIIGHFYFVGLDLTDG